MTKKPKHGGAREGAGRKKDPARVKPVKYALYLRPPLTEEFANLCKKHNDRSATFAHLVSNASKHTEK